MRRIAIAALFIVTFVFVAWMWSLALAGEDERPCPARYLPSVIAGAIVPFACPE